MTALVTCAEQIKEFGNFKYTYVVDKSLTADVYKLDKHTDATIFHTGDMRVSKVSFQRA